MDKGGIKGIYQDLTSNKTVTVNDSVPTEKRVRDIALQLIESTNSISIQTVLAEVKGVIYNQDDLEKAGLNNEFYIGAILATPMIPFDILPSTGEGWILPVNSAIRDYPVIGEMVSIITLGAQTFYHSGINISNNVNNNSKFGMSSTPGNGRIKEGNIESILDSSNGGFSINKMPRPVKQFPGDWAVNGRNDQSIRIGKTEGTERDSVIKIRIAEEENDNEFLYTPLIENVNEDVASVYLIRDETIKLDTIPVSANVPKEFSGPLIMVDSDQIVFNAKEGGNTYIVSGNENHFVSKQNTNIVGHNVLLGDVEKANLQAAVMGDQLVQYLDGIFKQFQGFLNNVKTSVSVGNLGGPSPNPALAAAASGLAEYLKLQTKTHMEKTLLSTNVKLSRKPKSGL